MKLKLYSKKALAENKDDKQLFMKLVYHKHDNDISVQVVDNKGNRVSTLLVFDQKRKATILMTQISSLVPLKTDLQGELLTCNDDDITEIGSSPFGFPFLMGSSCNHGDKGPSTEEKKEMLNKLLKILKDRLDK